ncbi:MAG: YfhO family protein [Clostridia bacterium]|nr:YfhO family protein [Clostridia bacterium]
MELSQTKKLHTKESGFQKVYPYLLSCGFVLVVYLAMLILRGIYPFGVNSLASYDLSAQICPFIEHIFDVLKGRSSLFYSHALGGGADLFGSLAYFIVSPFSPLFLVLGEGMVAEAAALVIGLKIVLLAFVGTWFASTLFSISKPACACLGVLYAFCGYTFVANTYINWLDILVYMPFAVWAFRRFVKTGSFWLFSLVMAACIYASFSIACFAMFTVYPALVCYGLFCIKKGSKMRFITHLSLSFLCAVLFALPILAPALLAYLRAARGGSFTENLFFGFSPDGFLTEQYLKNWTNSLDAKLTYILADIVMIILTAVYFVRSGLKTGLSKFMLVAGVLTLLPTIVDESMQLLNMGSYMSYALRFGFLNAIYFLGGACLGLDGLDLFQKEEKRGACLRRKRITPIVYGVIFGALFLAVAVFFAGDFHIKAANLFSDSTMQNALKTFSSRFAHSLGGIFAVGIFAVCVLLILGTGIILRAGKKLPMRLLSLFAVAIVVFQGAFFGSQLVIGNTSTQNVRWERYNVLAQSLREEDESFYRVRDFDNQCSSNIVFEGDTYAFTAFSSMLDKDNFPPTTLFGYSGNGKNISRGNGGSIFGDSFLGYKYLMVPEGKKSKVEGKSWYAPYKTTVDGKEEHLQKDGMLVYHNLYVFPTAFVVDSGEYRFVAENNSSTNRTNNQIALYKYLGGEKDIQTITGGAIYELTQKLWVRSGEISLSKDTISVNVSADEGQYLMVTFAAIDGYQVRVNGKEATLCENDLKLLCVPLEAGENVVEFTYKSPYGKYMLLCFFVGMIAICLVGIVMQDTKLVVRSEKLVGVAGIVLAAVLVLVFFALPTGVFIAKCVAMLL